MADAYGAYCGIRKVREDTVKLNLVGARSLEGLGASGRIGLEVFCLEGGGEVFRRVLRFLLR